MTKKITEFEAETLEEARKRAYSQPPEGLVVISEQIISNGKTTARAVADTTDAAFAKARSEIPSDAEILEERVVTAPETRIVRIEAVSDQDAAAKSQDQFNGSVVVKNLQLIASGRKGFLGIGKVLNLYEVEILQQSVVEIAYKTVAKISVEFDKPWRERFTQEEWKMLQTIPFWVFEMIYGNYFNSWMGREWDELVLALKMSSRLASSVLGSLAKEVFSSLELNFIGDLRPNKEGLIKVRQVLEIVPLKEADNFKQRVLWFGATFAMYRRISIQTNTPAMKGLISAADALGLSNDALRSLQTRINSPRK
jgi:hypothetical protein